MTVLDESTFVTKLEAAEMIGVSVRTLERLVSIPIETWNYKTQDPSIRHMGPMAQDFYAAFGLGVDDKHISTVDADGVALAAIQGLYELVKEKDAQIAKQQEQITQLSERLAALEARGQGLRAARPDRHQRGPHPVAERDVPGQSAHDGPLDQAGRRLALT